MPFNYCVAQFFIFSIQPESANFFHHTLTRFDRDSAERSIIRADLIFHRNHTTCDKVIQFEAATVRSRFPRLLDIS